MENANKATCPICGTPSEPYSRKRGWRIHHCNSCDHYHVSPYPTPQDLARIYSAATGYGLGREHDLAKTDPKSAAKLDALLSPLVGTRRAILDVGCGDGRLIYHMRKLGWTVAGTEIADAYLQVARSHSLDVRHANLDDAGFDGASFGAVTLGDVIEHSVHPGQLLKTIRGLLVNDGIIVIRTPNAGCGYSRFSGALARAVHTQWLASEAPIHLNDFTAKSLSRLVGQCGFRILSCQSNGRRHFTYAVGASGYLDGAKARIKAATGHARTLRLLAAAAAIAPVALWTAIPFAGGQTRDWMRSEGDYLSLVAKAI